MDSSANTKPPREFAKPTARSRGRALISRRALISSYTRAREYQIPSRLATQHDPAVAGAWLWKSRLRPRTLLPGRSRRICREIRLRGGQPRPPVERVSRASAAKGGSVSAVGDPAGTNGDQRPRGPPPTSILGAPDASKGVHPQPKPERLPAGERLIGDADERGTFTAGARDAGSGTASGVPLLSGRASFIPPDLRANAMAGRAGSPCKSGLTEFTHPTPYNEHGPHRSLGPASAARKAAADWRIGAEPSTASARSPAPPRPARRAAPRIRTRRVAGRATLLPPSTR